MTRDGILNTTAEIFFHQLREDTDFISLIAILASATEIHALLSKKRGSKKDKKERQAKVEELEKVVITRMEELGVEGDVMMKPEHRVEVKTAPGRRAKALLWAHLLRLDLQDAEFKSGMSNQDHGSDDDDWTLIKQTSNRSFSLYNLYLLASSTFPSPTIGSTPLRYVCNSSQHSYKLSQPASPLSHNSPGSLPNGLPKWRLSTRLAAESGSITGTMPPLRMWMKQRRSQSSGQSSMSSLSSLRVSLHFLILLCRRQADHQLLARKLSPPLLSSS